jgi:hypothetical protein
MRTTRRWTALALVVGWFGMVVLLAAPASADVNCSDLGNRTAAQTYFDGHAGDPDHLDADHDGQACESSAPHAGGTWTLIVLGLLFAAGLARYTTFGRDEKPETTTTAERVEEAAEVVAVGAPVLELVSGGLAAPTQHRDTVVKVALTGSVSELARALRMVPYGERMSLLEAHASEHGSPPQDVLDALATSTTDLELQGWALAGYDPPWTVRVMRCPSCTDGMRNFRLQTAPDGSHFWACATCHTPDRQLS